MGQRINLDSILTQPKLVTIRGQNFTLPGDIPIELVALMDAAASGDEATTSQFCDEALALFRVHHPDLDRLPLGLTELMSALGVIYAPSGGDDDDSAGPTRRSGAKTASRSRSTS